MILLALPASASARSEFVESFDGTQIKVNFMPTEKTGEGEGAPTVLFGPGWSSAGETDENSPTDPYVGSIGVGPLREAGYNVVTWDPRGFGDSGGTVTVDSKENEGRDVQRIIDFVAEQPEALLDSVKDPRVGMTGASYGGGIQFITAAIDRRVDVIAPTIAWNSLGTSLYKDETFKAGWGSLLYAVGQQGNLDPHIHSAYRSGLATGKISAEDEKWFISRGPGDKLVGRVRVPTLLSQGTVDTLFTLTEAARNYGILRRNDVPVKMLWFCGGHGACLTDPGNLERIEDAALDWLARWLKNDTTVDTGPRFDWIDQNGKRYTAPDYPPRRVAVITAGGSGVLPLQNAGGSGPSEAGPGTVGAVSPVANGTRASNAVNVVFPAPQQAVPIVGAPEVKLTYSGLGSMSETRVYAQIVDDATDVVLGNVVTPIPIVLDGQEHTVIRPLEIVSATFKPGRSLTLQIVANASNYDPQRGSGSLTLDRVEAALPVVDPALTRALAPSRLVVRGVRAEARRVTFRAGMSRGELRGTRAVVTNEAGEVVGRGRLGTVGRTRDLAVETGLLTRGAGYKLAVGGRRLDGSRVKVIRAFKRR